jgi:hypothetical protein
VKKFFAKVKEYFTNIIKKSEKGKDYQLNYHNETLARKKYELSLHKDELKKFIAKYANTNKDVLFAENLELLDELNKIYKVSNLVDFKNFYNYIYYLRPEIVHYLHMLLLQAYLYYDEENDKVTMKFGFGLIDLDYRLNNVIMLEDSILDEFGKKIKDVAVIMSEDSNGS